MRSNVLQLVILIGFLMFSLNTGISAGTPHTAYGLVYNSDNSVPGNGDITFQSYVITRPGEVLTETSTGCSYSGGYWSVGVGNFGTSWSVGEILRTEVTNTLNGETGTVDTEMTDDGSETADALYLEPVLPVELTSFSAVFENQEVVLKWHTKSESNNYGFAVLRRMENTTFSEIGFVPGFGTTQIPQSYKFVDQDFNDKNCYYQLKQIDNNGTFSISSTQKVSVNMTRSFRLEQNYPNPFNPETSITYHLPQASQVILWVYNLLGNEIITLRQAAQSAGTHRIAWNGKNALGKEVPSGIYILKIEAGTFQTIRKMIKSQ